MTVRTGRQYPLPYGSSLAILGRCPIPRSSSGAGPEEGLAFIVEVEQSNIPVRPEEWPLYRELVMKSILALVRHTDDRQYADFDPSVLSTRPTTDGHIWNRLVFRTKPEPIYADLEHFCRRLAKRISFAWQIANWVQRVESKDGHARAENCPIHPDDVIRQLLDRVVQKLLPGGELREHVRRWCEHPLRGRDDWNFYRERHMFHPVDDEAERWLIDNHYLVKDARNERLYCFTEKFVLLCWQDAMSNLA